MSHRSAALLIFFVFATILAGCTKESPELTSVDPRSPAVALSMMSGCDPYQAPPGNPNGPIYSANNEGEIFGNVYEDGDRVCGDPGFISLTPDWTTSTRLRSDYRPDLMYDLGYRLMWEFWDRDAGDGPCIDAYRSLETPHDNPVGNDTLEVHCVRPGRYEFELDSRSFWVEYLQTYGSVTDSSLGTDGQTAQVARTMAEYQSTGNYLDLVINVDWGSPVSDSAVLSIDASSNPHSDTFYDQPSPSGEYSDWFRFSVRKTVLGWSASDAAMSNRGMGLAKIFYRNSGGGSWTSATDYYDFNPEGGWIIRKLQFPGPTCPTTSRYYDVGVHIMNPTETPASSPDAESVRTIEVTRSDCGGNITAPSNLQASSVTAHSAQISWTNGESGSGTTTRVEIQPSGGSWSVVASALAAGVSSVNAANLLPTKSYNVRVRHTKSGVDSDWATSNSLFTTISVPSPSSLQYSNLTHNSVTISWTNGQTASGTTTSVEYSSGGSWTTAFGSLSAGTASANVTGLSPSTTYNIRVRHVYQGQTSAGTTVNNMFTTDNEPAAPAITSFTAGTCSTHWYGGKTYVDWPVGWTVTGSTYGWTWQINSASTNNVGSSSPFESGSSGTSATLSGIQGQSGIEYFWIRYVSGGASTSWYALDPASLDLGSCVN